MLLLTERSFGGGGSAWTSSWLGIPRLQCPTCFGTAVLLPFAILIAANEDVRRFTLDIEDLGDEAAIPPGLLYARGSRSLRARAESRRGR